MNFQKFQMQISRRKIQIKNLKPNFLESVQI